MALYLQAYEAAASGTILYNVARIYDTKLNDRAHAISFYRRYANVTDARADLVEIARQRLEQLDPSVPAASRRTADGSPAAALETKPGGDPVVAAGAAARERRGGWSIGRRVGVALGVAGLVGLGIGGGFGLAAMSNTNTAHGLCNGDACVSQQGVDAASAGRRDATISNIGFGAGGALLLTGAALYLLGGDRTPETGAGADLRLEARADASAWSLRLAGRW